MGPTALVRALTVALAPEGASKLGWGQLSVNGLIGYGALVAEAHRQGETRPPPPNRTQWEHLPDLDALAEQLRVTLG